MEIKYKSRIVDKKIEEALESIGCIVIEGPRDCGKSTTAEHFAKTVHQLDDDESRNKLFKIDPLPLLKGEPPVLIDEGHNVPVVGDKVRREVDRSQKFGQFILTGSATPKESANRHTGTGRMMIVKMSTMSLCESLDSSNEVDFKKLFEKDNGKIYGYKKYSLEQYAKFIVRGGGPLGLSITEKASLNNIQSYIKNLSNTDLRTMSPKLSEPRVTSLVKAISRNISTSASAEKIAKEAKISFNTLRTYLDQLTRVYLLDELEAGSPHIRSSSQLKVKPKGAFCDPSIATASLGITSEHLLSDGNAFGLFFEALALRDIRALANSVNGSIYYIADTKNDRGKEIDIIVELGDERWAAFEVKLGSDTGINEAVKNFEGLDNVISDHKKTKLMSKNIIIAGGQSYKREDNINVISLAHLFA